MNWPIISVSCRVCNSMKGTMMLEDFYMHITEVFWYLTEKKCGKEFTEKLYRLIQICSISVRKNTSV